MHSELRDFGDICFSLPLWAVPFEKYNNSCRFKHYQHVYVRDINSRPSDFSAISKELMSHIQGVFFTHHPSCQCFQQGHTRWKAITTISSEQQLPSEEPPAATTKHPTGIRVCWLHTKNHPGWGITITAPNRKCFTKGQACWALFPALSPTYCQSLDKSGHPSIPQFPWV